MTSVVYPWVDASCNAVMSQVFDAFGFAPWSSSGRARSVDWFRDVICKGLQPKLSWTCCEEAFCEIISFPSILYII